ncbi:DsrE family protein [Alteromonas gracilis]|uniref:DsrE family protein n=1 Tax=Alteromonas gracilis TaxID=1479524 RepID=UPI00321938C7
MKSSIKIKTLSRMACYLVVLFSFSAGVSAQMSTFNDGPVIKGFGKTAPVLTHTVAENDAFKIAFDVASAGNAGEINRKFDSLARFINMHVAAYVKKENIQLALVVHGKATFDLLNNVAYQNKYETTNANAPLLSALLQNNVRVILCGQSAAAHAINTSELVDGVEVQLSAMTAHALLQQNGYTVNPF